MANRIYLGFKAGTKPTVFRSPSEPSRESHGDTYGAVVGPFRTVRGASFMRDHGQGNPHCVTVRQAEILGKKYAKQ